MARYYAQHAEALERFVRAKQYQSEDYPHGSLALRPLPVPRLPPRLHRLAGVARPPPRCRWRSAGSLDGSALAEPSRIVTSEPVRTVAALNAARLGMFELDIPANITISCHPLPADNNWLNAHQRAAALALPRDELLTVAQLSAHGIDLRALPSKPRTRMAMDTEMAATPACIWTFAYHVAAADGWPTATRRSSPSRRRCPCSPTTKCASWLWSPPASPLASAGMDDSPYERIAATGGPKRSRSAPTGWRIWRAALVRVEGQRG